MSCRRNAMTMTAAETFADITILFESQVRRAKALSQFLNVSCFDGCSSYYKAHNLKEITFCQ